MPEIAHEDPAPGVKTIDPLNEHTPPTNISYADQQLQAERAAAAEKEAEKKADEVSKEARDFMEASTASEAKLTGSSSSRSEAKKDFKQTTERAEKKFEEVKGRAIDEYENNVKPNVKASVEKGKQEGKKAEQWADKNKGNPVVLGNAVAVALLSGFLGIGAYRMHKAGTLSWQVAGAWAGAVGAFAVGDYYLSQFFFKKYPPKN